MSGQTIDYENIKLSGDLKTDLTLFKEIFKNDVILRVKNIKIDINASLNCALLYLDGMVDSMQINEAIIRPLLTLNPQNKSADTAEYLETQILFARDVKRKEKMSELLGGILYGEAVLLIDGSKTALSIDVKGWKSRGINEPQSERVLQGPREGFEETAMFNLAMIRRKLQTPDLCVEMMKLGRRTGTLVFICYLETLTDKKILATLKKRLKKIDIDGILDSNYITEQIRDNKISPFKTLGATERPDIVASKLLEGRIAVVVDGTPVVLTLPYLFSENFQSDEDYYLNFLVSSIGRILRYLCFFLSILTPAVFLALTTFHKDLLPTSLAVSVTKLRGGVPFTPFSECLLIILIFEILKETGIRMPQSLGHALSIVGGLVIGQSAVEARIISAPLLIAIAFSGIAGLMIPKLRAAVFYLRLIYTFFAAFWGIFGILTALTITLAHIISLNSFGVDYTVSLRKSSFQTLKDTLLRVSWNKMIERPAFNQNIIRKVNNK